MSEDIVKYEAGQQVSDQILANVIVGGDLSGLTAKQQVEYYNAVCKSIGVNALTRPLEYIKLNGKLVLYARKDLTDQLRDKKGVSITKLESARIEDVYTVTAYASVNGRSDSSVGAVSIGGLKGDSLANALMKCETKAKRRVTLSICGLGMLDELELETIPAANIKMVDTEVVNHAEAKTAHKVAPSIRPYTPEQLSKRINEIAFDLKRSKPDAKANGKRQEVAAALSEFFAGDDGRHEFTEWLLGQPSLKDVDDFTVLAMFGWLKPVYDKQAGKYQIDATAQQELDIWVAEFSESEIEPA